MQAVRRARCSRQQAYSSDPGRSAAGRGFFSASPGPQESAPFPKEGPLPLNCSWLVVFSCAVKKSPLTGRVSSGTSTSSALQSHRPWGLGETLLYGKVLSSGFRSCFSISDLDGQGESKYCKFSEYYPRIHISSRISSVISQREM